MPDCSFRQARQVPGPAELVDHQVDLGSAPGRANTGDQDADAGRLTSLGWRRLHRRRLCASAKWDQCSRLHGQRMLHPSHLTCAAFAHVSSTRPREPPVTGPGMGQLGPDPATRRASSLTWTHLRDLSNWPRRERSTTATSTREGITRCMAIAAGTGEVLMSRLREGRASTARGAAHFRHVMHGGAGVATSGLQNNSPCGQTVRSYVPHCRFRKMPGTGCPLLHHRPSARQPAGT